MPIQPSVWQQLQAYLDRRYVEPAQPQRLAAVKGAFARKGRTKAKSDDAEEARPLESIYLGAANETGFPGLQDLVDQVDESFAEMLLRKIDESGMSDVDCYKRAGVDRKLFSKIRSDSHYRPSKPTAIAFAFALRLSPVETRDLLMKAGFALSRSSKFDIIVEFFLENGVYDLSVVNEALFAYDQALIRV